MVSKRTGTVRAVGRKGTVAVQMTADELLSLAVNAANGWSLDDLDLCQTANPTALNKMLAEVYEQILEANRIVVEARIGGCEATPTTNVPNYDAVPDAEYAEYGYRIR